MKLLASLFFFSLSLTAMADITSLECDPSYTKAKLAGYYESGNPEHTKNTVSFVDSSGYFEFYLAEKEIDSKFYKVVRATLRQEYGVRFNDMTYMFNTRGYTDYDGFLTVYKGSTKVTQMSCFLAQD